MSQYQPNLPSMQTSLILAALAAVSVQAQTVCVNGAYSCSGQSLQLCSYVSSTSLGWIEITTCPSGTGCSATGSVIGCVQGAAPATTSTTTTTVAKPTTSTTTTTVAKPTTSTTTTTVGKPTTTTTTTTVVKPTTTTTTTTNVPKTTVTTTTTTVSKPTTTVGSGLPACFAAWNSALNYNGNSQVSVNNVNYVNKWYQNAGASPVSNGDGGWVSQGPCDGTQPVPPTPGGPAKTLAEARAYAASLSQDPILLGLKHSVRTNPNIDSITPGNAANPSNVKRVERILTPAKWNLYFSQADPAYTYTNFLKSVGFFAGFCDDYAAPKDSDLICKKLLSTMFAHFAQETGLHSKLIPIPEWQQSLAYLREMTCTETNTISGCAYNNDCTNPAFNKVFPCAPGNNNGFASYFGRGAHQLSYSFNYGPFSQVIYGTPLTLLNNPALVADTWLNLASAVFFFLYPQSPKPSMLGVMDGSWVPNAADLAAGRVNDFPSTIQIINGECAGGATSNAASNRISYYQSFMQDMGESTASATLKCAGMPAFDTGSSAAQTGYYWTGSYLTQGVCQLVTYQTNFNALMDGPNYDQYTKCVELTFNVTLT
ncbi:UNVERIFIED_CONTAM: hypothetical protein HDU68_005582 [Siphonaria sp. JEL0065]|nr:hypothetical protein HDU68_005582 [Siphonaria sp. JEL0065]